MISSHRTNRIVDKAIAVALAAVEVPPDLPEASEQETTTFRYVG